MLFRSGFQVLHPAVVDVREIRPEVEGKDWQRESEFQRDCQHWRLIRLCQTQVIPRPFLAEIRVT